MKIQDRKKVIIICIILFVLVMTGLTINGGSKRSDVRLIDFNISNDGKTLTLETAVISSMGYTRRMKVKQGGDNKYITFYSTLGFNNRLGARSSFDLELNSSCEEIYFYTGDGGYMIVLKKQPATGEWKQPEL